MVCASFLQQELISVNKLGKVWFHSTILVKFHGCSVRNFKTLKQLFLKWLSITSLNVWAWIDNHKYQLLSLQNQKNSWWKIEIYCNNFDFYDQISTCCNKSDGVSHYKLRALNINTIKLNFVKKTSSMLYPVKRHLKYQEL